MQLHKLISQQLHILHFYANTWWQFEYAFGLQLRWSVNRQVGVSLSGRSCTNSPTLEGSRTCFSLGEKPEPRTSILGGRKGSRPHRLRTVVLGGIPLNSRSLHQLREARISRRSSAEQCRSAAVQYCAGERPAFCYF